LLNFLLNAHSRLLGLSEVFHADELAYMKHLREHSFWQDVIACYEERTGEPFADIELKPPTMKYREVLSMHPGLVQNWACDTASLLQCVAQQGGIRMLAESSKQWQRLYLLWRSGRFRIRAIHLLRDGRAVTNSYARKYGDLRGLRRWAKSSLWGEFMRWRLREEEWLRVHYEALASRPEATLRRICAFLGIAYEADMLDYRDAFYVGVGGNRMRKRDRSRIERDERWKQELSDRRRLMFNLKGGGLLNRYYGY